MRTWQLAILFVLLNASLCAVPAERDLPSDPKPSQTPANDGAFVFLRDSKAQFELANQRYEQLRFMDAVLVYERMLTNGRASVPVLFNLGNAQFKAGRTGSAIVAYRQAERLAPRDPDIRANLRFARARVAGGFAAEPPWWERALTTLTPDEWTALAAVAFWLMFLFLALGQWRSAWRRPLRGAVFVSGGAFAAWVACVASLVFVLHQRPGAVVTADEVVVRYGPVDVSNVAYTLRDGMEVRIIGRKDDWLQVLDGSQRAGWVRRGDVVELPATAAHFASAVM
jgi:hypothetical protein